MFDVTSKMLELNELMTFISNTKIKIDFLLWALFGVHFIQFLIKIVKAIK